MDPVECRERGGGCECGLHGVTCMRCGGRMPEDKDTRCISGRPHVTRIWAPKEGCDE